MFDEHYVGWRENRINTTINSLAEGFFNNKSVLEIGCGYGYIGNYFQTHYDCHVTCSEGREEHIQVIKQKIASGEFSDKLTVRKDNCEEPFVFEKRYDVLIHWGLLYHISNIERHLKDILKNVDCVLLETEVCDSLDDVCFSVREEGYDQSMHMQGSRPSPRYVERLLEENGFEHQMLKLGSLNYMFHTYDWEHTNCNQWGHGLRRFWVCWKKGTESPMKTQKKRCHKCKHHVGSIEILCSSCSNIFCISCRMPEEHGCTGFQKKIKDQKDTLSNRLVSEATHDNHNYQDM